MSASNRYAFGDFVLERSQYRVLRADGSVLPLTPRLFNALLLFVEHAGQLLDKNTLMQALWPGLVVEENNLSQVVSGLRRALGDDVAGTRFIRTVPRRGFVFVCPVRPLSELQPPELAADAAAAAAAIDASAASGFAQTPAPPAVAAQPGRRRWLYAAAGGLAAAGVGAWWWSLGRRQASAGDGAVAGGRLAVLPFKPLTAEGRDELLEVVMADSLSARLSAVPGLVVRSTGSVLRFGGAAQDPLRAARELDVDWIVDGSLQRRGEQLRATARLLRADSGVAAWTGSFDETTSDVFSMQDRIAARVTQALAPTLRTRAASDVPLGEPGGTRSTDAYQLYLAAAWRAQGTRADSTAKGIALLQQALAIDPNYAQAWSLLAWIHRRRLWRNDGVPAEVFAAAHEALQKALSLAPNLAQARAGVGFRYLWYEFDWPRAEREFRAALKINPSDVSAQWGLTQLLMIEGQLDEGFARMRRVRELDPMSPVFNTLEASYLMRAGRLEEARKRLDRALDIAPGHGLVFEAQALWHTIEGQPAKALAALRSAVAHSDGASQPKAKLAALLAEQGQLDEARAIQAELTSAARQRYVPPTAEAMTHVALDQPEAALDALERAFDVHDTWLVYLKDDPGYAGVRQHPRFAALLARLDLDRFGPGLMPI